MTDPKHTLSSSLLMVLGTGYLRSSRFFLRTEVKTRGVCRVVLEKAHFIAATIGGGPVEIFFRTRIYSGTGKKGIPQIKSLLFVSAGLGRCSLMISFVTNPTPPFQPGGGLLRT